MQRIRLDQETILAIGTDNPAHTSNEAATIKRCQQGQWMYFFIDKRVFITLLLQLLWGGLSVPGLPRPSLFASWHFFENEQSYTPIQPGPVATLDSSSYYKVSMVPKGPPLVPWQL